MYSEEEATKERVDAYVGGLETEIEGYEARIKRIELGRADPLLDGNRGLSQKEAVAQVQDRIKQCKVEIARVAKAKPQGKAKAADVDDAADEAAADEVGE